MISAGDVVFAASMLITAIILFWITLNHMLRSGKAADFSPFFFAGILLCFSSALSFYGVFDQKAWFVLELAWAIIFLAVLIRLRRGNHGNN